MTERVPAGGKGRELFTVHPDIAAGGTRGALYRKVARTAPPAVTSSNPAGGATAPVSGQSPDQPRE